MKKRLLSLTLTLALCLNLTVSVSAVNPSEDIQARASQMDTSLPPGTITAYTTSITVDYHSDYKEDVTIAKEYSRMFFNLDYGGIINAPGFDEETITCPTDKLEETIVLGHIKNYDGEFFDGRSLTILDKGIIIKQLKIQGQPTQKRRHWRQRAAFLRGG